MTPFIGLISYILVIQAILILYMALPFKVPFRRTLIEKFTTSSSKLLYRIRFTFGIIQVFVVLLFIDNLRQLKYLNMQVDRVYAFPSSQEVIADTTKRLHKTQRDFYILAFTLFCALVLYLLHLVVLRSGRYRKERNALRESVARLEKDNRTMNAYIEKTIGKEYKPVSTEEEPEKTSKKSNSEKKNE